MTTPARGRVSAIPTPGKPSGLPTPGRFRSSSSATVHPSASNNDDEFIARAFADAIKANDPGQHRTYSSDASLSATSLSSGRRSVAGRPTSSASSSRASDVGLSASTARPPSRTSDVFRSVSRAGRGFEVGDAVRIESLGFEGTLRYLGEIEGKPGLWAGVELGGGFAGKGKNNGTVAGKQYFSCPPYCGVFVATTKLSQPTTVSYGTISRPSSVASTRSGRMTPSISGRITPSSSIASVPNGRKTPSISNGRVTPSISNGRVTPSTSFGRRTPGIATPAARKSNITKPTVTPGKPVTTEAIITPGSRASKYIGMTAKQLSTRTTGAASPTRKSMGSPTRGLYGLGSPVQSSLQSPARNTGSPFNTPKAGRTSNVGMGMPSMSLTPSKNRPSTASNTPKNRIPSAIAMPPPASPSFSSRSVSLTDYAKSADAESASASFVSDLQSNQRALQDQIDKIMSGRSSVPIDKASSRPTSSASVVSTGPSSIELQSQIDILQARLEASESENTRLRMTAASQESIVSDRMTTLVEEKDRALSRITELETSLRTSERTINERDTMVESLERAAQESAKDIEKVRNDGEARIRDIQSKLEDKESLVTQLKNVIDDKEGQQSKNDAIITAKNAEIGLLEARVQKAYAELEEERRELGSQVDELRKAGQETIALYEERLSAADSKRYEMEDLIASLEEQIRQQVPPPSPGSLARHASSAAEIDNETLRDQIQYLQKKIASLEDELEDARMTSEREELAIRDRIKRYKEREEVMRKEVVDGRKEVDRVLKAEAAARSRVEEIEEALRENTVALENARAEIEGLRMEIANLEGIAAGANGETPSRSNRAQLQQEVTQLKQQLAEAGSNGDVSSLADQQEISRLVAAKEALEAALADERQAVASLRAQVDERSIELDTVRKKLNRDVPVNGLSSDGNKVPMPSSPSSKSEINATREEIKGLKHIVQELQKENAVIIQRNKVLESENKLLLSETEQLREDLKALEDNIEQSLLREEKALSETDGSISDDVSTLQQTLRDMKVKYEGELEQLRKRQTEAEMKSARSVHQLNKEIGELESLIESKIYREDELEREVERLQEKLARSQKKSSKTPGGLPDDSDRSSIKQRPTSVQSDVTGGSTEVCEICERPGHDIFNCDLLKNDGPSSMGGGSDVGVNEDLFCEDCEERGHTAASCPHSLDVF
ncbi:hypothetical protein BXZ70DRAFT_960379 [Cristinia sonorae]|uniref:CAP-Gly domain-containing protein n=1 Tax=Cristinia sonorae TaxID=1940300 RepID=A0A8K0UEA5_9AGAR|nr:hypothetical protein BXZ70DRAFT_960379 [Cristinia sonorae]